MPYFVKLAKAWGVFLNCPAHFWSSMRVWILSKGVRKASVQPAQKAAMMMVLWRASPRSSSVLLYCSYVPNIRAVLTLFCSIGGNTPLEHQVTICKCTMKLEMCTCKDLMVLQL